MTKLTLLSSIMNFMSADGCSKKDPPPKKKKKKKKNKINNCCEQ